MAITILPGYDFSVDEIPTRVLLERMARDLQITGVPAEQFSGTITAVVFGDASGVSGGQPTDVGWIWVDPGGNRVIGVSPSGDSQPRENARLWNAAGGWETSRYLVRGNAVPDKVDHGQHLWQTSTAFQIGDLRLNMVADDHIPYGFAQENLASPVTNGRILGRGLSVALVGSTVAETNLRRRRPGILTTNTNQATWDTRDSTDSNKTRPMRAGIVMGRSHGSTGQSFAGVEAAVWFVNLNHGNA